VNRHNKTRRSYTTAGDVNAALDDMLAIGEAHFLYLWNESSAAERLALTALSRMDSLAGRSSAAQVVAYLAERGVEADRRAIDEALHRLALRDILAAVDQGDGSTGTSYRWKLGLLSLWTEKHRPLSRAVEEVLA
jgi:hypothetical protein